MLNLFCMSVPVLATAAEAPSAFKFWAAAAIFVLTFVVIATEKIHKTACVLVGSALMLLFVLPAGHEASAPQDQKPAIIKKVDGEVSKVSAEKAEVLHRKAPGANSEIVKAAKKYAALDNYSKYVNFDVIFTLAGMMVLVNILSKTGLFQFIAIKAVKLARGYPARTMILLVLATAILSAFLDNVTTVLLVIPVTFVVASQMKVSPVPFIMAETLASNIGGTATLIGEPDHRLDGRTQLHGVPRQPRSVCSRNTARLLRDPLYLLRTQNDRHG